jgi:CubicO group peptidase (beta-lactamase class C family)
MILNNGTYGGTLVLKAETVDLIFTNFNVKFPGDAHGLGFELDQNYWSGPMQSLQTAGHTGYTGTSLAIDRRRSFHSDFIMVVLSNVRSEQYLLCAVDQQGAPEPRLVEHQCCED